MIVGAGPVPPAGVPLIVPLERTQPEADRPAARARRATHRAVRRGSGIARYLVVTKRLLLVVPLSLVR